MFIYVMHSQLVDGGAEPAILAEFGKGSVVRAMDWHSHALGSWSQQRSAGTNNNYPWQQSANTVKEAKSVFLKLHVVSQGSGAWRECRGL